MITWFIIADVYGHNDKSVAYKFIEECYSASCGVACMYRRVIVDAVNRGAFNSARWITMWRESKGRATGGARGRSRGWVMGFCPGKKRSCPRESCMRIARVLLWGWAERHGFRSWTAQLILAAPIDCGRSVGRRQAQVRPVVAVAVAVYFITNDDALPFWGFIGYLATPLCFPRPLVNLPLGVVRALVTIVQFLLALLAPLRLETDISRSHMVRAS